jgi:hypothetical protein
MAVPVCYADAPFLSRRGRVRPSFVALAVSPANRHHWWPAHFASEVFLWPLRPDELEGFRCSDYETPRLRSDHSHGCAIHGGVSLCVGTQDTAHPFRRLVQNETRILCDGFCCNGLLSSAIARLDVSANHRVHCSLACRLQCEDDQGYQLDSSPW